MVTILFASVPRVGHQIGSEKVNISRGLHQITNEDTKYRSLFNNIAVLPFSGDMSFKKFGAGN